MQLRLTTLIHFALALALGLALAGGARAQDEDEDEDIFYSCDLETKLCFCTLDFETGMKGCKKMQVDSCMFGELPRCDFYNTPITCSCPLR